ncbi:MAG: hypothetical protein GXO63_03550 [Candidatus Micrarchaeota archaeon]|nr:hypothetical protein [Candidatus Micrarchaeota archaeon]
MVKVEILKTHTCPWCPVASEVVKSIAREYENVDVIETFLETPEGAEKAKKLGVTSVPTILVEGKIFSVGVPDPDELRKAIEDAVVRSEGKNKKVPNSFHSFNVHGKRSCVRCSLFVS